MKWALMAAGGVVLAALGVMIWNVPWDGYPADWNGTANSGPSALWRRA
jgi:hypothetical protein